MSPHDRPPRIPAQRPAIFRPMKPLVPLMTDHPLCHCPLKWALRSRKVSKVIQRCNSLSAMARRRGRGDRQWALRSRKVSKVSHGRHRRVPITVEYLSHRRRDEGAFQKFNSLPAPDRPLFIQHCHSCLLAVLYAEDRKGPGRKKISLSAPTKLCSYNPARLACWHCNP